MRGKLRRTNPSSTKILRPSKGPSPNDRVCDNKLRKCLPSTDCNTKRKKNYVHHGDHPDTPIQLRPANIRDPIQYISLEGHMAIVHYYQNLPQFGYLSGKITSGTVKHSINDPHQQIRLDALSPYNTHTEQYLPGTWR